MNKNIDMKNINWAKIEPGHWNPENAGDELLGVYAGSEPPSNSNESTKHYIRPLNEFNPVLVWGSVVLDEKLKFLEPDSYVKIVYQGKEKTSNGREYKKFDVYTALSSEESPVVTEEAVE
jgi:hypothetical protein